MGYDYQPLYINQDVNQFMGSAVWVIVSLVIAFIGCFVIYFIFVNKDTKIENKKIMWLRDFLKFDKILIETILKIAYIFTALFITLVSFALISTSFVGFLSTLILGNLTARVVYELIIIQIMIWKNTTEIKNKLKK